MLALKGCITKSSLHFCCEISFFIGSFAIYSIATYYLCNSIQDDLERWYYDKYQFVYEDQYIGLFLIFAVMIVVFLVGIMILMADLLADGHDNFNGRHNLGHDQYVLGTLLVYRTFTIACLASGGGN